MQSPFDPTFADLPDVIPIFPLAGALLLPHGMLPLNIFEPRYLNMTVAALAAPQRLIGMIQPLETEAGERPAVYDTGCAGRVVSFGETEDGRYLITLKGIARFTVAEELDIKDGYRRVRADFSRFRDDLAEPEDTDSIERDRLLEALRAYLGQQGVDANWKAIESTDDARLVTSLAMMCPFRPSEKQALLEAPDIGERASVMLTLLEMALLERDGGDGRTRQ
jgi:Lon protease-like protein